MTTMESFYEFESCCGKENVDRISKMTTLELTKFQEKLEKECNVLNGYLATFKANEKVLHDDIVLQLTKLSQYKDKELKKYHQKLSTRFQVAKTSAWTTIECNKDRNVQFTSVLCNKLYNKICHYDSQKKISSNMAQTYLTTAENAIHRIKQKLVVLQKPVVRPAARMHDEDDDAENVFQKTRLAIQTPTLVDEDW
jgi:hypothetical protein